MHQHRIVLQRPSRIGQTRQQLIVPNWTEAKLSANRVVLHSPGARVLRFEPEDSLVALSQGAHTHRLNRPTDTMFGVESGGRLPASIGKFTVFATNLERAPRRWEHNGGISYDQQRITPTASNQERAT